MSIKIENIETYGWEAAIRGLRNPMNSWDKSDSEWDWVEDPSPINPNDPGMTFIVGDGDLKLMHGLAVAGDDHGKFARMINITMDITAPLYWWKEYDTYKVGTVANSCSTMHKIHANEFTLDDFSHEHLTDVSLDVLDDIIINLNNCRELFLSEKDKTWWWQMIQLLPSSYNQRRTVQFNYQVAAHIYFARKNHKLNEWRELCSVIEQLPYFREIFLEE